MGRLMSIGNRRYLTPKPVLNRHLADFVVINVKLMSLIPCRWGCCSPCGAQSSLLTLTSQQKLCLHCMPDWMGVGLGGLLQSCSTVLLWRRPQTRGWWFRYLVVSNSCDPMDCNLPGSSVHGILQARILEWVVISFSRGSSRPRNGTRVSCIASWFFTDWARDKRHT